MEKINYHKKYLKYKYKYIVLQNSLKQIGGKKIFPIEQMLYIVATITDPKLRKIAKQITDIIIAKNIKPYRDPHITLYQIFINAENPDSSIFQDPSFYNRIKNIYDQTLANPEDPLILESYPPPYDYNLVGRYPGYFIRNYLQTNPSKIFDFHNGLIGLIVSRLGKPSVKEYHDEETDVKYQIFSFQNRKLFLVPKQHYDRWHPHLDFLNTFDIQKHNQKLAKELEKYYTTEERTNIIVDEITNIPQALLEYIDMAKQMKKITYALSVNGKNLLTVKL